jgi:hypothetical protein
MKKNEKKPSSVNEPEGARHAPEEIITLTAALSRMVKWQRFNVWLVGDSPLICHAWSEKAKREMLAKMVKAVRHVKAERNPQEEFASSLYDLGNGKYGFPVTAVKKAILSQAHKDRGIPKTTVMSSLWLDFSMVQQRPALAGALCDMPIVRIYSSKPVMREDMVRISGRGGSTANFAYRAQFWPWAIKLTGKIDPESVPPEVLAFLVEGSGRACGIGDWRVERSGVFGSYHMADVKEQVAWEKFVTGKGPIPAPVDLQQAAE